MPGREKIVTFCKEGSLSFKSCQHSGFLARSLQIHCCFVFKVEFSFQTLLEWCLGKHIGFSSNKVLSSELKTFEWDICWLIWRLNSLGKQTIFNLEIKKKSGLSINPDIHHSKVFSSVCIDHSIGLNLSRAAATSAYQPIVIGHTKFTRNYKKWLSFTMQGKTAH